MGEIVGAPHIVWYVDHPFYNHARLEGAPAETVHLMVDPSHVDAIRAVYGHDRFPRLGFCPHAAVGAAAPEDADADAFLDRRPIPLLFCASFPQPEPPLWAAASPALRRVFDDALDIALAQDWIAPLAAVDLSLAANGGGLPPDDQRAVRIRAYAVDKEVRAARRLSLVKAVGKAGLPLHVYGAGWERQAYRFKAGRYGGRAGMAEIIDLMRRSRVVLNTNANFGGGAHERTLSAMTAGAAVVTDASAFYAEHFRDGEDLLLYRWSALDQAVERIARLCDHPDEVHALATSGRRKAVAGHSWSARLPILFKAAGLSAEAARA